MSLTVDSVKPPVAAPATPRYQAAPPAGAPAWMRWVLWGATVIGCGICAAHYFGFRSLWLDEAFVAVNIRNRPLSGLFAILSYGQQIPRLYLSAIWILTRIFGYTLPSLRLFPFLFGMASAVLWTTIMWNEFESKGEYAVALAAGLFVLTNHNLYYQAGELKQYTSDLFFAGFAYWWARHNFVSAIDGGWARWCRFAAVWTAPMIVSLTYPFVLAAVFVPFAVASLRLSRIAALKKLAVLIVIGAAFFALSFFIDLKYAVSNGELARYWKNFFIGGATPKAWLLSLYNGIANITGRWCVEVLAPAFIVLIACGLAYRLLAKGRVRLADFPLISTGWILTAELVVLAILKKYPLENGRLALFYFPFSVAAIGFGALVLRRSTIGFFRVAGIGSIGFIMVLSVVWKIPRIARNFLTGGHWEDFNPAIAALDPAKSTVVVYGSGTVAQVLAYPGLPAQFRFVDQYGPELVPPFKKGLPALYQSPFYYLEANPVGDLQALKADGKAFAEFDCPTVVEHLNFCTPKLIALKKE